MKVQRLGWAGVKISTNGLCILIDPVENFDKGKNFVLDTADAAYRFSADTRADYILLTHLHLDHYDAAVIRETLKPGGYLVCSVMAAPTLQQDGFDRLLALELDQTWNAGPVSFTPVFAMDGVGDKQVSWVVADERYRILHGGDTIWHNQFWSIGERFTAFDVAFLPANGAVMYFKKPLSPVPATLTPFQAAAAAHLVNARALVPIHYGFTKAGVYEEFPDAVGVLQRTAGELNVPLHLLQAGDELELPAAG